MPEEKESGRRVYHRIDMGGDEGPEPPQEEKKAEPVADARTVGGVSLARTLAPLLVGFALLVGLVLGLGTLSNRQLRSVSQLSFDRERRLTETLSRLLRLRLALTRLDNEARARDRSTPGGISPPGDFRLNSARDEVKGLLPLYDELALARTDKGRELREDIDRFIEITEDPAAYNQDGFVIYREIDRRLGETFEQTSGERQQTAQDWYAALARARQQINFLTWLAAATGLFVATATTLEVLRRFRQLRRSLEEVRRERQFNRQMLEGMVSAVAAVDTQNRLRSANASFLEIFPDAKIGAPLSEAVKSSEASKLLASATSTQVDGSTYHGRWKLSQAAGGERARVFDVYSSPLEMDGEAGRILTLVDVSEAAESERELRRGEALAAVGQAAAQLAHEIKNPLGSIRLGVAMLRDMSREREAINTIDLIERGIEHLSKLTSDVTQFSRRRELSLSEVDLHDLLEESFDLVADKVQEKQTPVEKRFHDATIRGRWDEDLLRQVFLNLLANAVDASPPQQPVTVTTERAATVSSSAGVAGRGELARVVVSDLGAGMDEATSRRVFEPFFTTKKKGTGLGLAIARQIVEQHGGTITVESSVGSGTSFTVELPLSLNGTQA